MERAAALQNMKYSTASMTLARKIMADTDPCDIRVIDIETTGLDPLTDEILAVTIIDGNYRPLLNHMFKPAHHPEWPEAQAINHIRPDDVMNEPAISKYIDAIQELADSASALVGFNISFDIGFLEGIGIKVPNIPIIDVAELYLEAYGQKTSLARCATSFGLQHHPHESLSDARATLYCFRQLIRQ